MFGKLYSRKGAVVMSRQITVGGVQIGGGAPVSIQSMTNTPTHDVEATLSQIRALAAAGCEIVRVAVPDLKAAKAIGALKAGSPLPLVADIHFDYKLALEAVAQGIDKIRINPGNIGSADRVEAVAKACRERGVPIRIGVNGGSLEKNLLDKYGGPTPEALVESALGHARLLEQFDFHDICISLKSSSVPTTMRAYQLMAERYDYPLHLGVTEAGTPALGTIKSAAGIGGLLALGIGDTFRVTLTADPVDEIAVAKDILKAVGLRRDGPDLIACPTCGRTKIDLIGMARQVEELLKTVDKPITVAVMGCVVNGPGEARHADVGIAGGNGEGVLFQNGEIVKKVPEAQLVSELMNLIDTL
jgi:(E)-4-hydroxy-3-methylbut-2-enyl-diphosphate synthase